MSAAVQSLDHFAMVPVPVIKSPVSSTALRVWNLMASFASLARPEVWVCQRFFAEELECSTDTIGRCLKELRLKGLLWETPRKHRGLYKTYMLNWYYGSKKPQAQKPTPAPRPQKSSTYRKVAAQPTARMPEDLPQICGTKNIAPVTDQKAEHFLARDLERLLELHEAEWKKTFPCLDGLSGRPSIAESVKAGLAHVARNKYSDDKIYLDSWLRTATERWLGRYNKEQNASPGDSTLDDAAKRRRTEAERLEKLELENKRNQARKEQLEKERQAKDSVQLQAPPPETPEELEWIVGQIRVDNEKQKRRREYDNARVTRASWFKGKEKDDPTQTVNDTPITRENYPIMWGFLRGLWSTRTSERNTGAGS